MLEEIEFGAKRAAGHLIDPSKNFEVTGLGIAPLGSVEVNRVHDASTWRYRMSDIIDQLNEAGPVCSSRLTRWIRHSTR